MIDEWKRIGATAMQYGNWTVAKVTVNGVTSYECRCEGPKLLGVFGSFNTAREFVEEFDSASELSRIA